MMEGVEIYKGEIYTKNKKRSKIKSIVFDLDKTLGDFTDLYILWKGIKEYTKNKNEIQHIFNEILDLYPEFLRCGILNILEFIKNKKERKKINKIFLYTNNRCSDKRWLENLTKYFDYKLEYNNFFDKIICAFKMNNKILNVNKHEKNLKFLINCTMIPKNTELCFIDNTYHKEMVKERIYYIQPYDYNHNLSKTIIINTFLRSYICNRIIENKNSFKKFLLEWFNLNKTNRNKYILSNNECIEITKKILFHVKEFFYISNNNSKTRKYRKITGNFTRKNM
jgi:hypothetical protein